MVGSHQKESNGAHEQTAAGITRGGKNSHLAGHSNAVFNDREISSNANLSYYIHHKPTNISVVKGEKRK